MQMRPRDLVPLRRDLVVFGQSDLFASLTTVQAWADGVVDDVRRSLAASIQVACTLRQAELYYIDEQMYDLVLAASKSLPEFRLELHDAPSRDGFIWLPRMLETVDMKGEPIQVHAMSWRTAETGNTFYLSVHVERDSALNVRPDHLRRLGFPVIFPLGAWRMPLDDDGQPMQIRAGLGWREDPKSGVVGERSLAFLKSLWLLMRQPLTQETTALPDRAERRRAIREGASEPPPVRVVQLRRPSGSRGDVSGSVEWHHQWIVRGHWRNQSWGPGRAQRRPVWISPFVKGPEGAPMLGGEKVYTVKGEQ